MHPVIQVHFPSIEFLVFRLLGRGLHQRFDPAPNGFRIRPSSWLEIPVFFGDRVGRCLNCLYLSISKLNRCWLIQFRTLICIYLWNYIILYHIFISQRILKTPQVQEISTRTRPYLNQRCRHAADFGFEPFCFDHAALAPCRFGCALRVELGRLILEVLLGCTIADVSWLFSN